MREVFRTVTSYRVRRLRAACVASAVLACAAALAQPSVPWTPSAAGRHALELLVDEAGLDLTLTQWPLPRAAVARSLDRLPAALAPALDAARARVQRELRAADRSQFSLTLRGRDDALPGFGDDATPGGSVAVRSSALSGELAAIQIGGRTDNVSRSAGGSPVFRLDEGGVATEVFGLQLQAWSHRSWWGPGWQSSLALSNNTPALTAIGFQRASASTSESPWLAWLGPWNYEFFVAQTVDARNPANAYLIGNRITLRPFSNLELGLTRTAQWGGEGRPQTARSFIKALVGAGTNADTVGLQKFDPANQLAGFDARLRCPGGLPCAAYAQLIGEDQAGLLPSKYLGLYGLEGWSADGRQRYFAEYAETACRTPIGRVGERGCAYRNGSYPEGYTSAGRWLGASVGPDSRLLTLGWLDAEGGSSVRLHLGRVGSRIGAFSPLVVDPQTSGRMVGIAARHSLQWGPATITPELDWTRIRASDGPRTEARVGATLRFGLDDTAQAAAEGLGASLSGAGPNRFTPLLVGAGLIVGSALLDHSLDEYARNHGDNPSSKGLRHVGDGVPIAGLGLAGLAWITQRGSTQGDVAFSSMAAGLSALGIVQVAKVAVNRARPSNELGTTSFGTTGRGQSAFPSGHTAVAWAVVTPYAKHYDAPWLYGLAALTNASRVLGREHWLSDTVGGAVLGYYVADRFYRASGAADAPPAPRLWITPRAVTLQVPFE